MQPLLPPPPFLSHCSTCQPWLWPEIKSKTKSWKYLLPSYPSVQQTCPNRSVSKAKYTRDWKLEVLLLPSDRSSPAQPISIQKAQSMKRKLQLIHVVSYAWPEVRLSTRLINSYDPWIMQSVWNTDPTFCFSRLSINLVEAIKQLSVEWVLACARFIRRNIVPYSVLDLETNAVENRY